MQKLELLSLIHRCSKWRPIVLGYETFIFTDHKLLTSLNTHTSKIKTCWMDSINGVLKSAKIFHLRGFTNVLADLMSRLGLLDEIWLTNEIKIIENIEERKNLIIRYHDDLIKGKFIIKFPKHILQQMHSHG